MIQDMPCGSLVDRTTDTESHDKIHQTRLDLATSHTSVQSVAVKTAFLGPTICHSLLMLVPCQDLETEKYTIDTLTFFTVFSVTRFSRIQIKLYFDQILNLSLLAIYCYLFFKIEALCDKWEEDYTLIILYL